MVGLDPLTCDLCGETILPFRWFKRLKRDVPLVRDGRVAYKVERLGVACARHQWVNPSWQPNQLPSEKGALASHLVNSLFEDSSDGLTVAELVRHVRVDWGLSREKLARMLGYTSQTVWAWEQGKHQPKNYVVAVLELMLRQSRKRGVD